MTIEQKIVNELCDGEPCHYLDIVKKLKVNRNTVSCMLRRLKAKGLVEQVFEIVTIRRPGVYQIAKTGSFKKTKSK